MFQGIVFDFDGTLYNYEVSNLNALNALFERIHSQYPHHSLDHIREIYQKINRQIKLSNNPATKFNKFIYIKQLVETLQLPLHNVEILLNTYTSKFYEYLCLYEGVNELFEFLHSSNPPKKIGVLSNNILSQQYDKLDYLGILEKINVLVTSDECGEQKPNTDCFTKIINKMGFNPSSILMVGDNWEADIEPALKLGMRCAFLSTKPDTNPHIENNVFVFTHFYQLHLYLKNIANASLEYELLSKLFGQLSTCVQGPGGNISVKLPDICLNSTMLIKSSGTMLANPNGSCLVDNTKLKKSAISKTATSLKDLVIMGNGQPSMESYFHSYMKRICIHLHYTLSNIVFCDQRSPIKLEEPCPSTYKIIPYVAPGIELSNQILNSYSDNIPVYFLRNHGIIFTAESTEEISTLFFEWHQYFMKYLKTHYIYGIADPKINYLKKFEMDTLCFSICMKMVEKGVLRVIQHISIPVEYIQKIKYCFPDLAIFIENIVHIKTIHDMNPIENLDKTSIICLGPNVFLVASSISSLNTMKEIVGEYATLCDFGHGHLIDIDQIHNLKNMEEEKYRKSLLPK